MSTVIHRPSLTESLINNIGGLSRNLVRSLINDLTSLNRNLVDNLHNFVLVGLSSRSIINNGKDTNRETNMLADFDSTFSTSVSYMCW